MFYHMTRHRLDMPKYLSEADFSCRFLAQEIKTYAASKKLDFEIHLEESMGEGAADLTIRLNREKLIVIEVKIDKEPWHPKR